jgi:hypothetical protein
MLMAIAVALIALSQLTRSWSASILDRYEFRQLQTALSAFWIGHDGWSLAYPTPLFGPPWSIPMEFPTYQVIVAALHHLAGLPLEQTGRLVSILMLFACLPALHDLLAIARLPRSRRLIVHALVLSSPVYLFYGRTFMIETTALCACVWFLALLRRALAHPRPGWIAAAALFGTLAALTKITTFIVFGLPAAALCAHAWRHRSAGTARGRLILAAATIPAVTSLGLAWWWVRFSDAVKDSNPFSGFLTARELRTWNFGTWALRGDWSFWLHLFETINGYVFAEGAAAVALLCLPFAPSRVRWVAGVAFTGFLTGPLVFANLYHLHDYYYAANALLLLAAAGVLLAAAWDDPRWPRGANWLALGLVLGTQWFAYYRGYDSYNRHPAPQPPALAAKIRAAVPTDGVVLIYGADWNPLLPYYMQRRAVMVPGERENETAVLEQVLARLPPHAIAAMVVHGDKLRHRTDFVRERTTRFSLAPAPAAGDADNDLYLPAAALALAAPPAAPPTVPFPTNLKPVALPDAARGLFHPAPDALRTRYGIGFARFDGHPILNAHAPSELEFSPPVGAKIVTATFGLPDAAFASGKPVVTDGITVGVIWQEPGRPARLLYFRRLDPAHQPGDRGPQQLMVALPAGGAGRLLLRFGNGPAGNPANDWAYWRAVDLH